MLNFSLKKMRFEYIKTFVSNTLKRFEDKEPPLGRWRRIEGKSADKRIDWANEDHCGPCGQLKVVKEPRKAIKKST